VTGVRWRCAASASSGRAARGFTGTNPRPVLLEEQTRCALTARRHVLSRLDALVRDQVMSMKTTFTPGHYRRRVAGVLSAPPG
jgi:hypothetical protein